jgi:hypothetical protein
MLAFSTRRKGWVADMYRVYNHNNTLLGEFATKKEAEKEAMFYMSQTGNAAYVVKEEK